MALPRFITFTGADDETSIDDMLALSRRYPIEWGILMSPTRRGSRRYPSLEFLEKLTRAADATGGLRLSAHLCGGYSRSVLERGFSDPDPLLSGYFARAQINTSDPDADPAAVQRWAAAVELKPIMQSRAEFPEDLRVSWLFDASGGRGLEPAAWPAPPARMPSLFVGYAGGLAPHNVQAHVQCIGELAQDYWIDMETGVRDGSDRFSMERCRLVCELVYGKATS